MDVLDIQTESLPLIIVQHEPHFAERIVTFLQAMGRDAETFRIDDRTCAELTFLQPLTVLSTVINQLANDPILQRVECSRKRKLITRFYRTTQRIRLQTGAHLAGFLYSQVQQLQCTESVFRLQAYPRSLETEIGTNLHSKGIRFHPSNNTHTIFLVCHRDYTFFDITESTTELSSVLGYNHTASLPGDIVDMSSVISRAYYKLAEAEWRLLRPLLPPVPNSPRRSFFDGKFVLDLGAAPGGWSQYVLTSSSPAMVVAVDPGDIRMDATVWRDREVFCHVPQLAADAAASGELARLANGRPYDVILCDCNIDPREAADMVAGLAAIGNDMATAPLLAPDALLVLTLKVGIRVRVASNKKALIQKLAEEARQRLEEESAGFRVVGVEWLLSNSRSERTLIARREAVNRTARDILQHEIGG